MRRFLILLTIFVAFLATDTFARWPRESNPELPRSTKMRGSRADCDDPHKRWFLTSDVPDPVLWLDRSIRGYEGDSETWTAIIGPDFEQNTGTQQPTLTAETTLMGDVDDYDGTDDHRVIVNLDSDADTDGDPQFGTSYFKLDMANGTIDIPGLTDAGLFGLENLGSELHTDANAASLSEADATTGWSEVHLSAGANVFESQSAIISNGSYALHANSNDTPTNVARFYKDIGSDFSLVEGNLYKLTIDFRHVGTGGAWSLRQSSDTALSSNVTERENIANTETAWSTSGPHYFRYSSNYRYIGFREQSGTNDGGVYVDRFSIQEVTNAGPGMFGASGTTYVLLAYESTGVSVWGGYTGLGLGQAGAYEVGADLLTNGNFDADMAGSSVSDFPNWTETGQAANGRIRGVNSGVTTPHSGTTSVELYRSSGSINIYQQSNSINALSTYEIGFYTKGDGTNAGRYTIRDVTNLNNIIWTASTGKIGVDWAGVSVFVTAPENCTILRLQFLDSGTNGTTVYFDSAYIKPVLSPGTSGASIFNSQDCTTGGSVWQTSGFNPNDVDRIIAYPADLNLTGDQTWIVLLRPDDGQPSSGEAILGKYESTLDERSLLLWQRTDGKLWHYVSYDGDAAQYEATDNAVFSDGTQNSYTMIAVVYSDNDSITLFNNGSSVPSTLSGALSSSLFDSPTLFSLGTYYANRNAAGHLAGRISAVIVFPTALTADQIKNIWEAEKYYKDLN